MIVSVRARRISRGGQETVHSLALCCRVIFFFPSNDDVREEQQQAKDIENEILLRRITLQGFVAVTFRQF